MQVYNATTISGNVISENAGKSELGKDAFLKIFIAQLQNQDLMNTTDNSQYIAQMAEFSLLEQMQNLNQSMNQMLLSQKLQEGSSMIGKLVKVSVDDGYYISGQISAVKMVGGAVSVVVDGEEYSIDNVFEVSDKGSEAHDV